MSRFVVNEATLGRRDLLGVPGLRLLDEFRTLRFRVWGFALDALIPTTTLLATKLLSRLLSNQDCRP